MFLNTASRARFPTGEKREYTVGESLDIGERTAAAIEEKISSPAPERS
jgi:hypothetical protein